MSLDQISFMKRVQKALGTDVQVEMAKRLGISQSRVSDLLKGTRVGRRTARKVADALGWRRSDVLPMLGLSIWPEDEEHDENHFDWKDQMPSSDQLAKIVKETVETFDVSAAAAAGLITLRTGFHITPKTIDKMALGLVPSREVIVAFADGLQVLREEMLSTTSYTVQQEDIEWDKANFPDYNRPTYLIPVDEKRIDEHGVLIHFYEHSEQKKVMFISDNCLRPYISYGDYIIIEEGYIKDYIMPGSIVVIEYNGTVLHFILSGMGFIDDKKYYSFITTYKDASNECQDYTLAEDEFELIGVVDKILRVHLIPDVIVPLRNEEYWDEFKKSNS